MGVIELYLLSIAGSDFGADTAEESQVKIRQDYPFLLYRFTGREGM